MVELRPPRLDCLVEWSPIPDVLWLLADFCLEPPDMKPECTTVIELELGALLPRLAGPTLFVWCGAEPPFNTVLPPGPNTLYRRGLLFS